MGKHVLCGETPRESSGGNGWLCMDSDEAGLLELGSGEERGTGLDDELRGGDLSSTLFKIFLRLAMLG